MKEFGGYLQAEKNWGAHYHPSLPRVNSGRNGLLLIIQNRKYKRVHIPAFLCDTVNRHLEPFAELVPYNIEKTLEPAGLDTARQGEAVLLVNYFGMYDNQALLEKRKQYGSIIVDNTQAFFLKPAAGIDTVYTCRKFFGVTDGAYAASEGLDISGLEQGKSLDSLGYLFGRLEDGAQKHFDAFHKNEDRLVREGPQRMSAITENLLAAIDYARTERIRRSNYGMVHDRLAARNALDAGRFKGWFMYPFLHERGEELKRFLISKKIFVPTLWPNVAALKQDSLERRLARNLVALPIDQRYDEHDIAFILGAVEEFLSGKTHF